ncbi:MAG: lipid asymmetry maintenance protein MlaB [Steroidobacteraceae bacterium]
MARRTKKATTASIALPANCSIRDAAQLKAALLELLPQAAVTIDAGAVERIDTSGMQLLATFTRDRAANGFGTEWCGVKETLHDAATILGLAGLLGLPPQRCADDGSRT